MVNRKTFALAAAIAFLIPLAVVGDDVEEILEYSAQIVYELTDIDGIPIQPNLQAPEIPIGQEQIVEGHTVFHTMEMVKPPPPPPKEINIIGLVECRYEILGVALDLSHIDRIYVECNVGGRIWISETGRSSPETADALVPTGWERVAMTPDTKVPVLVTEYEYWAEVTDEWGQTSRVRSYCWETRILKEGHNPVTAKPYNFVATINLERLAAMGSDRLSVWVGGDEAALYHAPSLPPDGYTYADLYGDPAAPVQEGLASGGVGGWDESTGTWR